MSASLVGSEMCIRDRVNNTRTTGEQHLARRKPPKGQRKPRNFEMQGLGCLLYTSDAADDM
eukprot:10632911-Alexandrium_andersonii.AAC.1